MTGASTVLAAAAIACAFIGGAFVVWRRRAGRRALEGSRLAATARGAVEYGVAGSGPPVVLLHGGLGGFDQGLLLATELGLAGAAATVVCPSRGGYLRTALGTARTPEEGADAIAFLLDTLGMARVGVVGVSGGGPTALQFVLRHPDRVSGLIMVCAISRRHEQPDRTRRGVGRLLFSDAGMWLIDFASWVLLAGVSRLRPSLMAKWFLAKSELVDGVALRRRVREVAADPERMTSVRNHLSIVLPLSLRKAGLSNDLAQFARLADYPVERISCPTLVVHGELDGNVPLDHAEFVAGRVPGATLRVFKECGHFFTLSDRACEARACVTEFLQRHAKRERASS